MSDRLTRILQKKSSIEQAASDDAIIKQYRKTTAGKILTPRAKKGIQSSQPTIADECIAPSITQSIERCNGQLVPDGSCMSSSRPVAAGDGVQDNTILWLALQPP